MFDISCFLHEFLYFLLRSLKNWIKLIMKTTMNLTSPWRHHQSQRFMTIFGNFRNQSLGWILKTNHNVTWLYLGILKTSRDIVWLYLGILTTLTYFKNQSHRFMTIFSNFINEGVTNHSNIKIKIFCIEV